MLFKASAPGSLMLMGEYAVLHGGHALVCAVNKRITVTLSPRADTKITIVSALGNYTTDLSQLESIQPFQFVLTTLKKFQHILSVGCDIKIQSEFSDQIGFASSAAVTVALLKVIYSWLNITETTSDMIKVAREIVRTVQGIGSGADVAACVLGGVVAYRAEPFLAEKITYSYPLTVIYSGSKTKTADAIAYVKNKFSDQPDALQKIFNSIDQCACKAITAIKSANAIVLGQMMSAQQIQMENLGVNNAAIDNILSQLKNHPTVLGAKISGSGLGDCVVGLGDAEIKENKVVCAIDSRGVCNEEN